MSSSSSRVVFSCARQDGETFAMALRRPPEREHPDLTLWQDRARMKAGVRWWKQIEEAMEAGQFLVVIMTAGALQSA